MQSLFLVFAAATLVAVEAAPAAVPEAEAAAVPSADPAVLVSEHRNVHSINPGLHIRATKHLPGYGYKEFEHYKPPVSVQSFNTRHTLYPEPHDFIHPALRFAHYASPVYGGLQRFPLNPDFYGGGIRPYGISNYIDDDEFYYD